ncbi:MAG: hypothetical protein ISS49_03090 [Anaerolineae bacterium]|nr:hypothetical protein [Anaerolineae bacterium]
MSSAEVTRLRRLLAEGVACVAAEEGITIIDGGTQAGVMQMIGEGRAAARDCALLLGVCPAALVSWPGRALSPPVLSTADLVKDAGLTNWWLMVAMLPLIMAGVTVCYFLVRTTVV